MNPQLIKELRERTGSGFIDCKKALEASNNDIEKAILWLQENGAAKAVKKASRIAAEGLVKTIVSERAALIFELNSETDFVAKNFQFAEVLEKIGNILMANDFKANEDILKLEDASGKSVEKICLEATSVIGEKISFRRAIKIERAQNMSFGAYTHSDGQKAALFIASGASDEKLKGIAMHITAMAPEFLDQNDVPVAKFNEIKLKSEEELKLIPGFDSKPDKIKEAMLLGKIAKILSEFTLLEQDYVVEPGKKVAQFLKDNGASAIKMIRFEVGEGIIKNQVDFAAEVRAQLKK